MVGCGGVIADVGKEAEGFYRRLGWSPPDVVLIMQKNSGYNEILQRYESISVL